jgi:hypothetical protein
MIPDITVLTTDAATGLSTLLAVMFFAYIIEIGRMARNISSQSARVSLPIVVMVTFVFEQVILLGTINAGGIEGSRATITWIGAIGFALMYGISLVVALSQRQTR